MTTHSLLIDRLVELGINKLPQHVLDTLAANTESMCKQAVHRRINPASVAKVFAEVVKGGGLKGAEATLTSSAEVEGQSV